MRVKDLVRRISSDLVVGLSVQGRQLSLAELAQMAFSSKEPTFVVGGFPHGHFAPETVSACNQLVRIHSRPLEAHVVASRMLYEVEKLRAD